MGLPPISTYRDGPTAPTPRCRHGAGGTGRTVCRTTHRQHLSLWHGPVWVAGWEPAGKEVPARCEPSPAAPSHRLQSPVSFQMQRLLHGVVRLTAGRKWGACGGDLCTPGQGLEGWG